jgi:hypothetical protein
VIDRDVLCLDPEKIAQQLGQQLFRHAVSGFGDLPDFRGAARGLAHSVLSERVF